MMSPSTGCIASACAQLRDRRVDLAARVQRDGVDVGEARVAGLQPGGAREFSQRGVAALQARQHQPERVVQRAALRRATQPGAQDALALGIAAERAVHVGEIDVRGNRGRRRGESPTCSSRLRRRRHSPARRRRCRARHAPRRDRRCSAASRRTPPLARWNAYCRSGAQLLGGHARRAGAPPRCESSAADRTAAARRVAVAAASGRRSTACSAPKRMSALESFSAARSASSDGPPGGGVNSASAVARAIRDCSGSVASARSSACASSAPASTAANVVASALVRSGRTLGTVPRLDLRGRPLRVARRVTARAGVGRAELDGERRARNAQAVIVARVDDHVGRRRHVTARARRARAADLVMRVLRPVVLRRQVTGRAHRVAVRVQLSAVRIVAVAARHALRVHAALEERAPVVHLVALLAVGVVQRPAEQGGAVVVEEAACPPRIRRRSARVASDTARRSRSRDRSRAAASAVALPVAAFVVQRTPRRSSSRAISPFVESGCPPLSRASGRRPRDVARAGAVTRLAADADLRPARVELIGGAS